MARLSKMEIRNIDAKTATEFLMPRHYSGRKPPISEAYAWINEDGEIKAVVTFGKPASNTLCTGVCGEKWSKNVYELNRLCRTDDLKEPLSQFVGGALRRVSANDWIIVSYSDTAMNHHGYIYQACNFLYTGATKARTDKWTEDGKHSRHYDNSKQNGKRKYRSSKHRYIYFATRSKTLRKEWLKSLNYATAPYPKGDNSKDYPLGFVLCDKVIDIK